MIILVTSLRMEEATYKSYSGTEWFGQRGGGDYATVGLADIHSSVDFRLENAVE